MTINITNVKLNGDYIRVTATGEFNLKVPRGPDAAYDFFAETAVTLSHDDIQAIQKAIDDEAWHEVDSISYYPNAIDVDGVQVLAERSSFQGRTG